MHAGLAGWGEGVKERTEEPIKGCADALFFAPPPPNQYRLMSDKRERKGKEEMIFFFDVLVGG